MPDNFDFLRSINENKQDLMEGDEDGQTEKSYQPFIINRFLSYFPDTVLYANEVNVHHHMDKRMQYDYLRHSVRQRKRFSKWMKPEAIADLDVVAEYLQCNKARAKSALAMLTPEQLAGIKAALYKGGRK